MNITGMIFCYLVIAWFVCWWPFNENSSWLKNSHYAYVVYFYLPHNKEENLHLGIVNDLQSCNALALDFANSKRLSTSEWGYVCCKITSTSNCAAKER